MTFMDANTEKRLATVEQANGATPNDIEEETERSTRAVATGFPPDTSEAKIRKFLQYVMQQESLAGQVAQVRFTADSTTRLSDVRRKARKEPLRNSVTTQPTRGRRARQTCTTP